jgi:hypothetical protein
MEHCPAEYITGKCQLFYAILCSHIREFSVLFGNSSTAQAQARATAIAGSIPATIWRVATRDPNMRGRDAALAPYFVDLDGFKSITSDIYVSFTMASVTSLQIYTTFSSNNTWRSPLSWHTLGPFCLRIPPHFPKASCECI